MNSLFHLHKVLFHCVHNTLTCKEEYAGDLFLINPSPFLRPLTTYLDNASVVCSLTQTKGWALLPHSLNTKTITLFGVF